MLKALLLLLLNLALAGIATAQNLVPNPSFEDTTACGQYPAGDYEYMLGLARPWFSPNRATPDIYDCDLDRSCGQPMDPDELQSVFQLAYDGERLSGAFHWYGPGVPSDQDTREYLMTRLLAPLAAGQSYEVSLHYSRAEGYGLAIDRIGVHLGFDSISVDETGVLDVAPQVLLRDPLNTYLAEGVEWVQLVDTFIASGGEEWMTIGTFDGSDAVNGTDLLPGSGSNFAYYYVDQVSVVPVFAPQFIGELTAWRNGYGGLGLRWAGREPLERLRLYDSAGRLLLHATTVWSSGQYTLQPKVTLASGVYNLIGETSCCRVVARLVSEEGVD